MASSSSDLLVTRLRELRRRATLVLFAQALCLSGAVLVLIGDALVAGGAIDNPVAAVSIAATAGLLSAAAATIFWRPGLRDIAASVDARLRLQDRLVTALQFNGADDPFSQLVVRDAHSRVAGVRAADAVPFALPRSTRAACAAAAIVSAVMIVASAGASRWSTAGRIGFGGQGVAANAASAPGPAGSAAQQQPNPTPASSIAAANGTERSSAGQQPAASEPEATTPSAQARSSSDTPPRSSGDTERLERGPTAGDDVASTNTGSNTPDKAGVARGAASTSREQGGGGVANGERSERPTATAPPDDSTYRAAYRNGRAAAESAVVQDRVPADLRSYVRDYFVAIRPAGDK